MIVQVKQAAIFCGFKHYFETDHEPNWPNVSLCWGEIAGHSYAGTTAYKKTLKSVNTWEQAMLGNQ
jgi:hypothetical protein